VPGDESGSRGFILQRNPETLTCTARAPKSPIVCGHNGPSVSQMPQKRLNLSNDATICAVLGGGVAAPYLQHRQA
jgi:hypothetical protein